MKYPRTYHFKWSEGITNDDKISNSLDNLIGNDIIITEKLDGSNTAITKNGVYGRSHGDFSKNPWDNKSWEIYHKIKNDLHDGLYIFGEGMYAVHSIEYENLTSFFYILGVRDNNIWIPWSEVEVYSFLLDLPTVPVLFKGVVKSEKELKSIVEDLSKGHSSLGGIREGVVCRNASSFHNDDFISNVIKWVRPNHVRTDSHWTRNWKKANIKY